MLRIFENKNYKIETIKKDELYFKAKEVATILGYENTRKALIDHVSDKHKKTWAEVRVTNRYSSKTHPNTVYVTEPGLYQLIFKSHLPAAKQFQKWVFEHVLPELRKNRYTLTMFSIENEFDLHRKVVEYLRRYYPHLLIVAGLGENQNTAGKRIKSWQKGYQKGQPDLIIQNLHYRYQGFCIEFKTPKGKGTLSEAQSAQIENYKNNNYKTLVSSDYDEIIWHIIEYCRGIRVGCQYCRRLFKSDQSLHNHTVGFHKIL